MAVELIAKLLKEIPAAAKYKAELEALEQENERLITENADEIAQAYQVNVQIVEMYLNTLLKGDYIHAPLNGAEQRYSLAHKGRRYLSERGLLKQGD